MEFDRDVDNWGRSAFSPWIEWKSINSDGALCGPVRCVGALTNRPAWRELAAGPTHWRSDVNSVHQWTTALVAMISLAAASSAAAQAASAEVFGDQVRLAFVVAPVVDRQDMRMVERRGSLCFRTEPAEKNSEG